MLYDYLDHALSYLYFVYNTNTLYAQKWEIDEYSDSDYRECYSLTQREHKRMTILLASLDEKH